MKAAPVAFASLVAFSLTLAAPVWADTPERAALLVEAMRDNGCAMTGDEADAILPGMGLSIDEVDAAISVLYPAGLVTLSEDGEALVLSDALCAADATQSLTLITGAFDAAPVMEPWSPQITGAEGAALIGALRDNDCALSEQEAGETLPALGLDMITTRDTVAVLLQAGAVTLSEDGGTLRLSETVCTMEADGDAALTEQALLDFQAMQQLSPDAEPLEVLTQHFGLDGIRAMTALYAETVGCTIAIDERAVAETAIADFIAEQMTLIFSFVPDWPEDARAELFRLVGATLDDPGPEFTRAGDILTLTNCTP